MKYVSKRDAQTFSNASNCSGVEYNFDEPTMNGALIAVNGRYPERGYVINEVCQELAFVVRGTGTVCKEGQQIKFEQGDTVFINNNEKFFWDGDFDIYAVCSPAFYPEQHRELP